MAARLGLALHTVGCHDEGVSTRLLVYAVTLIAGGMRVERAPGAAVIEPLSAALGRRAYSTLHGIVSLLILAWVVVAAGRAPHVEPWPQLPRMRWIPNLAMPLAAVLTVAGIGAPMPFTLGGRKSAVFDPAESRPPRR